MVHRRTLIATLLASAVAFAATAFVYRRGGDVRIDFERGYEGGFVDGFEPRERAEGKFFRWTDDASFIELWNLPARGTIAVELRLKTIRPAGVPLPSLAFTANGVTVHRAHALPGVVTYHFEFPSRGSRLRLGIESETFEAGGGRRLGVQVLGVALELSGTSPAWFAPAAWMASSAFLLFAAGIVSGLGPAASSGGAVLLSLAFVHLLGLEAVRVSSYPRDLTFLAGAVVAFAAGLRAVFGRLRWLERSERAAAVALLSVLLLVKVGALTYPLTISSDAEFQANRMRELLQGNWHPTSVTQHEPPFRIPYPVALYVAAAPLARLGVGLVTALELTAALGDVLVSGLLLFLGRRFLDDFRAGAVAALLYQLVPMNALSFSAGNFTNLFAVSMLALAFTFAVVTIGGSDRRAAAALGLASFLALTAHFGALVEGVVLFPVSLLFLWLAPAPVRDGRKAATASVAASFIAASLYYLGYLELLTSQWGRALSREGASSGAPELSHQLGFLSEQLGFVFLATVILGGLPLLRRPLESAFSAVASAFLLVTLLFLVVDAVTPLEVRYWLQALPLLALLSGAYLSRAFDRGRLGRTASVAALVYMGILGLRTLYEVMVSRYH